MHSTQVFRTPMIAGYAALRVGNVAEALALFEAAQAQAVDHGHRAEALQQRGIALRELGQIAAAIDVGTEAMNEANQSGNADLVFDCKRELAASYRKQAIRLAVRRERDEEYYNEYKFSRDYFLSANELYDEAVRHYAQRSDKLGRQKYALTLGMHGLLLYDMETYCSLTFGSKELGVRYLKEANAILTDSKGDAESWEIDTLARLMRVSDIPTRISLLARGLDLTDKLPGSPGSRRKILNALLGNQFCNWLMLRNLEVTDEEISGYQQKRLAT